MTQVKIIAEIGINHNGSMDVCKQMMWLAKNSGCDYAKIQKRNPDVCVPDHQKNKPKSTPWGDMTYLEYKKRIEFSDDQIRELVEYGEEIGISLFASVWDVDSVKVMAKYTKIAKIGSASITDLELCRAAREAFDFLIISTGMSTEEEIETCVAACNPDVIMHTNSTYPCPSEDLNLNYINWMKSKWEGKEIGYSGHEFGLITTFAAVAKGVSWVERHITLDRTMWGSDQSSSVGPEGVYKLVRGIRELEKAIEYDPAPRRLFEGENVKRISLRKV